ncbi:Xanthoxin dehydrogenase [Striga hermonthica]|uniref:Xanthoxin dehydrogenase n=1 Tax=Striga hermonthica TaxID=68872 RepID=A0A9N7NEZ9_STRHE|nr:Xanthoxin dehydrogenase [Striga hermonthica]
MAAFTFSSAVPFLHSHRIFSNCYPSGNTFLSSFYSRPYPAVISSSGRRSLRSPLNRRRPSVVVSALKKLSDSELVEVSFASDGILPSGAGVYAVYDGDGELQFVGKTRNLAASVLTRKKSVPELCFSVKVAEVEDPDKNALTEAWKSWVQEHIDSTGKVPPGNEPGNSMWVRNAPHRKAILEGQGVDYESVDVLDDEHNRGLGETLKRLVGKVALVTGGASGIGESIVRLFHGHGAKVCIADIQDNLGQSLSRDLGPHVSFIHCDVTVEDDISRAVDFVSQRFGPLNIMVNNAGIGGPPCPDIRDCDLSVFEHTFDVNVKGVFLGMKHAARAMIPARKGSIVSLSSVASVIGGVGPHAYTGSKHAVVGLTKSVAAELGKHGVRVNCVSPYAVATGLALAHLPEEERTEDAWTGFRNFVGANANLQGVELTVDDVANAVLFLASDEARYVSGVNLMVDGGFTSSNHSLRVFR